MRVRLGKVCLTPRGQYSASATYERLDLVKDGANAYVSLSDGNTGHPVSDSYYWMLLVNGSYLLEYIRENGLTTSTLTVTGDASIDGSLAVEEDLSVDGDATITGDLTVLGDIINAALEARLANIESHISDGGGGSSDTSGYADIAGGLTASVWAQIDAKDQAAIAAAVAQVANLYVSWNYWNTLFELRDSNGNVLPSGSTTNVATIVAKVDFASLGAVSALGVGSGSGGGGGGGGVNLNEPLSSINTSSLGVPSSSGQTLVWNGTAWTYGTAGSGSGSVTSVAMTVPTGFSITGSPITNSGTLALGFASGYSLPTTVKQNNWDAAVSDVATLMGYFTNGVANTAAKLRTVSKTAWGQTFWTANGVPCNVTGSLSDVVNITMSGKIAIGGFEIEYDSQNQALKFNGDIYATGNVSALGAGGSGGGGGGATTLSALSDVSLSNLSNGQTLIYDAVSGKWKNGASSPSSWAALSWSGYSSGTYNGTSAQTITIPSNTNQLTNGAGFITSSALSGYATETWVSNNFNNYVHPTNGSGVTISAETGKVLSAIKVDNLGHVTSVSSKTLVAADIPNLSWSKITSGKPTTLSGYGITDGVNTSTTWWGRSISNGAVTGDMTSVGSITMSGILQMTAGQYIAFNDGSSRNVLTLNNNVLALGYGTRKAGLLTDIQGAAASNAADTATAIQFKVGTTDAGTVGMKILKDGTVHLPLSAKGLRIGDGLLTWDATNNALKVSKSDGTAAHLYALGEVSALGFSSGSGGTDSATIGTLTSTAATITTATIGTLQGNGNNAIAVNSNITMSSGKILTFGGLRSSATGDVVTGISYNSSTGKIAITFNGTNVRYVSSTSS